ncbi:hypothetical protein RJ640_029101 [Escallonia rubra]|uniref:Peptidase S9A N-terminal domain-containing protein n=1 Tax=Escallonia rubra TaxID=112253 RepID=A0AA88UD41_9ASTE|nr:hypothetical protein RJ640_029101 [Escallonia rubra]
MTSAGTTPSMPPPVAKKVRHEMEMFGDVRIDDYYWLRDDSRSDPEVLSYLHQENAYTDSVMSGETGTSWIDTFFPEPAFTLLLQEWGDPRKEEYYFYMKSYSPVDNIAARKYPVILVTAGLNGKSTVSDNAFHFLFTAEAYFLYRTSVGRYYLSFSIGRYVVTYMIHAAAYQSVQCVRNCQIRGPLE